MRCCIPCISYSSQSPDSFCKFARVFVHIIDFTANTGDLDTVNKLVKSIDRICDVIEMDEEDGYSNAGSWNTNICGNYGDHVSYGGRRRDSRGRYSRDNGGYSRNGGYSMDGDLIDQLEEKMRNAKSEREREDIRRAMEAIQKG